MRTHTKKLTTMLSSSLLLSLLALAGCDKPAVPKTEAANAPPAAQAASYTPPTAEQLSQMVAPIALFPDKLVGQVLAGATHPQQIGAASQWLEQNSTLKADALQAAESSQPWDVSVKSLTTFPSVLAQMAGNMQWTTSLGEAYANDPTDVMNAIQLLRSRAQQSGNLKTSDHLRVVTSARASAPPPQDYIASSPSEPRMYDGPAVIAPPPQTIVIESAQPDVVYVPQYNPAVVYGEPIRVYPGWSYHQPAYATSTLVETGALSFGIGVLVGSAVSHHDGGGWNSWGVNWGAPDRGYDHGWHRPAVVYHNAPYISKSVTVVNRVNNVNVTNNTVNNSYNNNVGNKYVDNSYRVDDNRHQTTNNIVNRNPHVAMNPAPSGAVMSMPHFTPHDAVPHARPPALALQAQHAPQPHANQFVAPPQAHLHQLAAAPHGTQPDAAPLAPQSQPTFAIQHTQHTQQPHQIPTPHIARQEPHPDVVRNAAPPQQAPAPMPNRPMPGHDLNLDRAQAHAVRQDVLAMHPVHARPAEPAQAKHAENHAEHGHAPEKHDGHDGHGGHEHHA